jgi:L-ornithine Nalpha-acyltransferase
MLTLRKGRYTARMADTPQDVEQAQALRHLCFVSNRGLATSTTRDADAFDDRCHHILVEEIKSGALVCCFRLLPLKGGADIASSYSAQYYDLAALSAFTGPMVEMGRFCIHPNWPDPDILRVAWGAMTRYVDDTGVEMLFGCSSFDGADAAKHHDALALLKDAHLAPKRWLPRVKAPRVFRFARALRLFRPDAKRALIGMPPLLRTYLMMGGWVSDHAVLDTDLNTLHVFTGLEIRAIPPARARLLRAITG